MCRYTNVHVSSKYSRTLMARTLKGLMKTVRARGVFELSRLNYIQTLVKGQQKRFETSMVFRAIAVQAIEVPLYSQSIR